MFGLTAPQKAVRRSGKKKHPATGVTGCMIHVRKRQPQAWWLDE